jgi:hypothetical protein
MLKDQCFKTGDIIHQLMARRMQIFEGRRALAFVVILFSLNNLMGQSDTILIFPPALSASQPTVVDFLAGTLMNSRESMDIYLFATIEKNGRAIGNARTATFSIALGPLVINSLNADDLLSPVEGNYATGPDEDYINRTGAVPPGDYKICVTAKRASDNSTMGEQCYNTLVMDLNPPILVMPMNGDVVDVPFPTFIWTPPTPLPPQPTYRLRLAPLLSNQSPVAALGNNTAFHDVDGLLSCLYQYPIAARQMEDGRRYAWQIGVYVGGALMTQSEIFTFDYRDPHAVPPSAPLDKVIMIIGMFNRDTVIERRAQDIRFFKDNGELRFSEQGHFALPTLVYKIMDKDQKPLTEQIVFEPVGNGLGYRMRFFAPENHHGQQMEYLNYVSPGGEVFSYWFRE